MLLHSDFQMICLLNLVIENTLMYVVRQSFCMHVTVSRRWLLNRRCMLMSFIHTCFTKLLNCYATKWLTEYNCSMPPLAYIVLLCGPPKNFWCHKTFLHTVYLYSIVKLTLSEYTNFLFVVGYLRINMIASYHYKIKFILM